MSEDLHGRTWCMAGSGKARYESDHSFHVEGKRVDPGHTLLIAIEAERRGTDVR